MDGAPDYKKLDGEEFARSFANWVKFADSIDWRREFPDELWVRSGQVRPISGPIAEGQVQVKVTINGRN